MTSITLASSPFSNTTPVALGTLFSNYSRRQRYNNTFLRSNTYMINFLLFSVPVKECWKSVNIWLS